MLLLPAIVWLLAPRRSVARPALKPADSPAVTMTAAPPRAAPRPAPPSPPASASAALDDDAPVTGVVLDPDGKPAPHAFVGCDDRPGVHATSTDDEGRFRLGPEASGCSAVANHPEHVLSDRAPVVAGRDNVLRLNRGGAIEGEVVDDRGAPIASYMLAIESYRGRGGESSPLGLVKAIQDPRGAFAWDNLVPGAYVLTANADGRPPTRSRSIDVEAGRRTHHVRIVLARGATLTGRVTDADSRRPIAGASVSFDALSATGVGGNSFARTDESGAYTLAGAPPGPFSIRVAAEGYTSKIIPGLVTRGADSLKQDAALRLRGDGGPRDELAGVGAVLAPTASGVLFGPLVAGGPAEGAGLRPGDRIRRIDGEDASAMTMSDCVQRLRGIEGSIVDVQVERGGEIINARVVRRVITR